MMESPLLGILLLALVLSIVWWIIRDWLPGKPGQIAGIIFALILVVYALHRFGIKL